MKARVVITADVEILAKKIYCLKENVDLALQSIGNTDKKFLVLVAERQAKCKSMEPGRDFYLNEVCTHVFFDRIKSIL